MEVGLGAYLGVGASLSVSVDVDVGAALKTAQNGVNSAAAGLKSAVKSTEHLAKKISSNVSNGAKSAVSSVKSLLRRI